MLWNLFCYVQQVLYCSVSETASDTQCMRSWTDPKANVDTVERGETLENSFIVSPVCIVFLIQIVPGMHMVIFSRIVEKDNVCY